MNFIIPENICYLQAGIKQQAYKYANDVISQGGTVSFRSKKYSDYNALIKGIHDYCEELAQKEKALVEQLNKPLKKPIRRRQKKD
jgi:hypothetical protein